MTFAVRSRSHALALAVLVASPVLAFAPSARAEMDVPPRRAASPELQIVLPAVLGGALFVGGYAVTAITTTAWHFEGRECYRPYGLAGGWACEESGPSGDTALASLIPLVGPWVMLNTPGVDAGFAVAMGLTQLAGVVTVAVGVPLAIRSRRAPPVRVGVVTGGGGARLVIGGTF